MSAHRQMQNDLASLPGCYWYVKANKSIEPIGNDNERIHKRLSYFSEGA